ncbi:3-hydroxybenzoate 6-hydroxylase-like protein [Dipodascopsis tothii]|uniref:3-hydroxybenzoate 6-hydroxylase-like protein n=1 Tax=Dipodascopsis tothii TaxID=44089 RepID=UPI0034CEDA4D
MSSSSLPEQAATKLSCIVIGAGLGGLAAAIAIARKGHSVTVFEQAPALGEVGAGIQMPPNTTCLVEYLGLTDKFAGHVVLPRAVSMRRFANGALLGSTPLNPFLTKRYRAPYWLIHRADYHRILHDGAVDNGVDIRINSRVVAYDDAAPSVTLADGSVHTADFVLAADGIRSLVRSLMMPELTDEYVPSGSIAYRTTIDAAKMRAHPELAELLDSPFTNCWMGPGGHVIAYPIRNKTLYNVVMLAPGDELEDGLWANKATRAEVLETYKDWDPKLVKILGMIDVVLKWKVCYLKRLDTWVSPSGKLALLGDSAHATVPYLAQGAAQAIEDGVTVAELVSAARSPADVPALLRLYEKVREPRATRVQLGSMRNADFWHLADGPQQQRRDADMLRLAAALNDEAVDLHEYVLDEEAMARAAVPEYDIKNPNPWSDVVFQPWLFGHNAVKTAQYYLKQAGY